jgi:vacuolar-type H+-ATPase subunit H
MKAETEEGTQTAVDYLEHAVEDLNQARQEAQEEVRSAIDSAIDRAREALEDLRSGAQERADNVRTRAEERAREWQRALEDAGEDVRKDLGIRAVHAQRSEDALDAMAKEIKNKKKERA